MKFTKTIEVKNIFNKISYKYDFLNNLLSFGLHRLWKRKLVNLLAPLNGEVWADSVSYTHLTLPTIYSV